MIIKNKLEALQDFTAWVEAHITGDEKGEAQIFLDRLFRGFGWPGLKEAGASCEERVKNNNGGTSFADMVWKPVVVIEMKKRGIDLAKHYRQAFDYWTRLVPDRPRYAILCNFDEFWIYDFETQLDTPVDILKVIDLPSRYGPLNFMFPGDGQPMFGNHQEVVTRLAADKLAECFNSMILRGIGRSLAQRFILQMMMSLFAENIGLIEKYFVTQVLEDCRSPTDTYDLLGGLFEAMNKVGGANGGRFKDIPYFNGGLFADPARVELVAAERILLKEAAKFNWSKVRPEIFGTLFEHSLGQQERHAFGAHFTSPTDIMKIVGPTIVEPWRAQIESATTLARLTELLNRIENFTVLDPACGSGNFLYIAYRELKRLEARIYERMAIEYKSIDPKQRSFGFLSARNFFGLDVNPFAIDIAKVTMMLAHKLSIDELNIREEALPLDNLDANFKVGDALIKTDGTQVEWPKTDVIIGNPPFLGAKLLKPTYGAQYVSALRSAYPAVPPMADFCVYWVQRVNHELKTCTKQDPVSGRAGLVGTQNIRNNASRIGGLDYVAASGEIIEAITSQPWSGEAKVHVSIANWVKTHDASLLPKLRKLWFKVNPTIRLKKKPTTKIGRKISYELDFREVTYINSGLTDKVDVSLAASLIVNKVGVVVCQGITPGHSGFVLSKKERDEMLRSDKKSGEVIFPYLTGDDLLSDQGRATRWLIDFKKKNILQSQPWQVPFLHLQSTVLPTLIKSANAALSERAGSVDQWWIHWRARTKLITAISALPRYLVCSRVTMRPLFAFIDSAVRPGDALQVFGLADDYSFGILQSNVHFEWFHAKCSNFKSDPRYTSDSVFQTFPWPQAPSKKSIENVVKAARELQHLRVDAIATTQGGLRALYATLDVPGKNPLRAAHENLDQAVWAAYGFSARIDLLQQVLTLNKTVHAKLKAGGTCIGPGVPPSYQPADELVSSLSFGL